MALPKRLRDDDQLNQSDVLRLQRLAPGRYLLEKLAPPRRPKAVLVKSRDGFLVFRPPKGARRLTGELVKKLEAETL